MLEVALGLLLFTALVTGLAAAVCAARAILLPHHEVRVTVNDRAPIRARAGEGLLRILTDAGVQLPSACGGTGTCGLCRVTVVEGASPVLPTELVRISRHDAAAGVRLACLTPVRADLGVRVPAQVLAARTRLATVRSARTLAPLIKEVVLGLPAGETLDFRAGAFVQVTRPVGQVRYRDFAVEAAHRGPWDGLDLWRLESACTQPTVRAYSLANPPGEAGQVVLLVRLALPPKHEEGELPPGLVSSYLFSLRPGDEVVLSGPYGEFFVPEDGPEREMVLLGGGVGMAPLHAIVLDQLGRRRSRRPITFWYGARSRRDLLYAEELDRLAATHENFHWHPVLSEPAPEDAWAGPTGFVHRVAYEQFLRRHPAPEDCAYYLCGPPLMIEAVRAMLEGLGVDPASVRFDDFGGSR